MGLHLSRLVWLDPSTLSSGCRRAGTAPPPCWWIIHGHSLLTSGVVVNSGPSISQTGSIALAGSIPCPSWIVDIYTVFGWSCSLQRYSNFLSITSSSSRLQF